ncbi:hypothetical protein EWM64_g7881 [Hericium alpestre]|uniref:Threonine synthase n=1 Tax=Hericium alpestre TaxID=135208 RepID=A0A4Y9ZRL6_9AGAM|nr:hypothetical protein EWM64_g7881 [Hericium alpestre]
MDILVSSNFERLLWYLAYESAKGPETARRVVAGAAVNGWMGRMKSDGRVEVPVDVLELARRDFMAERISDDQTLETIQDYYLGDGEHSYIADPHTAVGLAAARIIARNNPPSTVQVILSTAHPAKFAEAVNHALYASVKFDFEKDVQPKEFKGLLQKPKRVIDVEAPSVDLVKKVIEEKAVDESSNGTATGSV